MLSFEIEGGRAAANRLVRAVPDLAFAPTLGDIGTTLSHPPTSSHRALTPEGRAALGIGEGFFRVSVGCEDPEPPHRRIRPRRGRGGLASQLQDLEVEPGHERADLADDHLRVGKARCRSPGTAPR
jgi:hypothetical protein